MNKNLEIFKKLVKKSDTTWIENVKWRKANKEELKISINIALTLLHYKRKNNLSYFDLSDQLNLDYNDIVVILKGNTILNSEILIKVQNFINDKIND